MKEEDRQSKASVRLQYVEGSAGEQAVADVSSSDFELETVEVTVSSFAPKEQEVVSIGSAAEADKGILESENVLVNVSYNDDSESVSDQDTAL